jgi:hypothetical protein
MLRYQHRRARLSAAGEVSLGNSKSLFFTASYEVDVSNWFVTELLYDNKTRAIRFSLQLSGYIGFLRKRRPHHGRGMVALSATSEAAPQLRDGRAGWNRQFRYLPPA